MQLPKIKFEIVCSKGTYIRSIANDFGNELNSGGYLSKLKRIDRFLSKMMRLILIPSLVFSTEI